MPDQLARGFELRRAIGQPEADGLVVDDGRAETLALLRISDRHLERTACHPDTLRRDADAPAFERRQRDAVALALLTDQMVGRDAAVVEIDLCSVAGMLADLVLEASDDIARRVGGNQERAHALL